MRISCCRFLTLGLAVVLTVEASGQDGAKILAARDWPDAPSSAKLNYSIEETPKRPAKAGPWRMLSISGGHLTNRQVVDKKFMIAHGILLASMVYDNEVTHQGIAHHHCPEGNPRFSKHPSRGELYGKDLAVFVPTVALDFFLSKYVWKGFGYAGPILGSTAHFRGGSEWLTGSCW